MRSAAVAAGLAVWLHASAAGAGVIHHLEAFSASLAGTFLTLTPFDPALGELDEVRVSIQGTLATTFALPTIQDGFGQPLPFDYGAFVDQDFFGLAGRYFEFSSPARAILSASGPADGGLASIVLPFSLAFTFGELGDSLGFTFPSGVAGVLPPPTIVGSRARFLAGGPIDQLAIALVAQPVGAAPVVSATSSGVMHLEYNYTPVPEPGGAVGIGMALAALAALRRRSARA